MSKKDAEIGRLKQTMFVISVHFLKMRATLRPTISACASILNCTRLISLTQQQTINEEQVFY